MVTEYSYDAENRLTKVHFPASPGDDFTYGYDRADSAHGVGQLTSAEDLRGAARYAYDGFGYLASIDRTIHGTDYLVKAAHDATGNITRLTYPSGLVVSYAYDDDGQVHDIDMDNGGVDQVLAQQITHVPFGNETGLIYGNGLTLSRQYDKNGRLTELSVPDVLDTTYSYDADGHLTARTSSGRDPATFRYDAVSQLTGADGVIDAALGYTYDSVGNRTESTVGDDNTTYDIASGSNRLTGIDKATDNIHITHDAAGLPNRWGDLHLSYDDSGHLHKVKNADGNTVGVYGYDSFGRRIAKNAGGEPRYFIYGPSGHMLGVYQRDGTALREFVWADDRLMAVIENGTPYYVITNAVGAPVAATNASKEVVWRWHPLPFGGGAVDDDPDGDGQAFTLQQRLPGQYADAETGFYTNGFRDYDPASGRYLEPDPIGLAGGMNSYVYVDNNPLSSIDPYGLYRIEVGAYFGFGGSLIFGRNEATGQYFLGGALGVGFGGGVTVDPDGASPDGANARQCDAGVSLGGNIDVSAGLPGFDFSLLSASGAFDFANGISKQSNPPSGIILGDYPPAKPAASTSVSLGATATIEIVGGL